MLALLPERDREALLSSLTEEQAQELLWDWRFWARPEQMAPDGDWSTWVALAGRGFGKTEAGAQWIQERVNNGARSIALVAETQKDLEEVMVARLVKIAPPGQAPTVRYKPVRVAWPSGATAFGYVGTEPNQLRGPEFDTAWVDEFAKYRYAREAWDMLQFTMRAGDDPRVFITTTPRPIPVLKEIIADPTTVVTKGSTFDNAGNLAPTFLSKIRARYEGTRLGRQELDAEILDDLPGALWTRDVLDRTRVKEAPAMRRVVVAIDPSGTGGADDDGDSVGIVVAGKGTDGRGYVLADRTCKEGPAGWARAAVDAYNEFQADRIVAEANFGGAMVESTIRAVDPTVSYRAVKASRGKVVRAEPIAALYEQGRVSHVGAMAELEDQMCDFGPEGYIGDGSPDRADALVWAMTELEWGGGRVYDMQFEQISTDPFAIPAHWLRSYAISIRGNRTYALWGAVDPTDDTAYIYSEHSMGEDRALAHAAAIKTRGDWLRGVVDPELDGNQAAAKAMLTAYKGQGLSINMANGSVDAGISQTYEALATGKLRVFSTLTGFANEFRSYARDDADNIIKENDRLMNCLRCWVMSGRKVARTRPVSQAQQSTYQPADRIAGY